MFGARSGDPPNAKGRPSAETRCMSSPRRLLQRPAMRVALLVGTTGAGIGLFLTQARPGRLFATLAALPMTALLTAVGATMAGVMLGAVRWRRLLAAGGADAPTPRLFAALTIGSAVNNLVPARGGDAVRVESAHQLTGASRVAIVGTLLSERILDAFVLAVLIVSGALLVGGGGAFLWIGISLAGAIGLVAVVAGRFAGRVLRGRLTALSAGLAVFRLPSVALPSLGASAAIWFADVVMYAALARGFRLDVSFGAILLLVGVGNLALAVPGAAAGLGSFELVTLAGAHGIGVGGPELAAFVLAAHAVIVLPTTVTGLLLTRVGLPKAFRLRAGETNQGEVLLRTAASRSAVEPAFAAGQMSPITKPSGKGSSSWRTYLAYPVIHARPPIRGTIADTSPTRVSFTMLQRNTPPRTPSVRSSSPAASAPRAWRTAIPADVPVPLGDVSICPVGMPQVCLA